jgi:HSP20 family protein
MRDNAAVAMKLVKEPVPFKSATVDEITERCNEIYEAVAERAFKFYADDGYLPGHDLEHWFKAEAALLHPLNAEIVEHDNQLVVRVEVPGFDARDLDVRLEPTELTITGKREAGDEDKKLGKTICAECSTKRTFRVIELPLAVDPAKAEAALKDGILELRLPKATEGKKLKVAPTVN